MSRWISRPLFCTCLLIVTLWISAAPVAAQRASDGAEKLRLEEAARDVVIVYSEPGFRGRSERFRSDDRRLDDNRIGNDGPVSIRIPRGCRVALFEHYDFVGISVELDQDVADLGRTRLGRNEASSLRVSCASGSPRPRDGGDPEREIRDRRGALVFSESGFQGRYQFFRDAVADLSSHELGDDAASSVRVGRGCRLTLFAETNFRGESVDLRRDVPNLRQTPLGSDVASSLLVDCGGTGGGVTLFSDSYFRGESLVLGRDVTRLSDTRLGSDRVGSVRVSSDCRATLFEEPGFRGRSLLLDRDAATLAGRPVGPDAASSIRVQCKEQPGDGGGGDSLPYGSGAVLYDRGFFRGEGVRIQEDAPRLSRLPIGNDRASSIEVAPGCEVRLFRDVDFRGSGVLINGSVEDLNTVSAIGSDELSSIRIRCNSWRR